MSKPTTPIISEPISDVQKSLIDLIGQYKQISKREELQFIPESSETLPEWPPRNIEAQLQDRQMFEKFTSPDEYDLDDEIEIGYQKVVGNMWRMIDSEKHLAFQLEKIRYQQEREEKEQKEREEQAVEMFRNTYRDMEFDRVIDLEQAKAEYYRQLRADAFRGIIEIEQNPLIECIPTRFGDLHLCGLPAPMPYPNDFYATVRNDGEVGYENTPNARVNCVIAFIRNMRK